MSHESCDLKFSTNSDLGRHIAYVHSENTISCTETGCDMKFAKNYDLQKHIRCKHQNIRNFECSYENCNEKFHSRGKLKRHTEGVHLNIQAYACPREGCNESFSENSNLRRHIMTVHDRIRNFECPKCHVKFFENSHCKNHIRLNSCGKRGSSGENKVKEILEKFGFTNYVDSPDGSDDYIYIYDEPWKDFEKTRKKGGKDRLLKFDFRIPMVGAPLIIEYDGKHHFSPQRFSSQVTKETAQQKFVKQKKHDKQKNDYCEDNGVPILRIPYYDFDKSEALIKNFLETYTTWAG